MSSMHDEPTPQFAEKRCARCGETKPLEDFHRNRETKTGRASWCKACHVAYGKARRADPVERDKHRAACKRWYLANRDRNAEFTRRWWAKRGQEYTETRKAAGVPPAGTVQRHAERLIVLERDDGVCGICGKDVDPLRFDLDHIVPTSRGGMHELSNLQLAHRSCNSTKGTHV